MGFNEAYERAKKANEVLDSRVKEAKEKKQEESKEPETVEVQHTEKEEVKEEEVTEDSEEPCAVSRCNRPIHIAYKGQPVCKKHWEMHCEDNNEFSLKNALSFEEEAEE